MKNIISILVIALTILVIFSEKIFSQVVLETPGTNSVLYLGNGDNQPLVVGFGGSEGGNAWASKGWEKVRNKFLEKGYAFLAVGYFSGEEKIEGLPDTLSKISIENIHLAIQTAANHPKINKEKIALLGGSTGAELALVLGSYYSDIKCVVGIVPSHVVFPGHTMDFSTSCWTYQNKELPFVPVTKESVPFIISGEYRKAFEEVLKDTIAEQNALIKVENINGPVLLLSATQDEVWPSTEMSEKISLRLAEKKFNFHFEHIPVEGGHTSPLKQFDRIFLFLDKYFMNI